LWFLLKLIRFSLWYSAKFIVGLISDDGCKIRACNRWSVEGEQKGGGGKKNAGRAWADRSMPLSGANIVAVMARP
jgi:hypothetical protein